MKVISKNLKDGIVKARIEVLDDLWYLSDIIEKGDIVTGKTRRRMEKDTGKQRADRDEKRTMTLSVEVESVEFDENADRLRAIGKIVDGPTEVPRGSAHAINIYPGMDIKIQKEQWDKADVLKLKEAQNTVKAKILLIAIEDGTAAMGILKNYGVAKAGYIHENIAGKDDVKAKEADEKGFFKAVMDGIEKSGAERIIVAGPGFVKENFADYVEEKNADLRKKIVVENVSTGDEKGLQEIIKRGVLEKVVRESKVAEEVTILEKLFAEISKEGLAEYGLEQVKAAATQGAVETLLVSNEFLKKSKIAKDGVADELIKSVENGGGKVMIISEKHELGGQFEGLGGVGAVLRYKV
jgi:protein pelota